MVASFFVKRCLHGLPCVTAITWKFELIIDLKSAKMLGIDLRPTLLPTADDVIE